MNDIINFFETSQYEYLKEKDKSYLKNTSQFFTLNCRKAPFFRCGDERQGFNYFNKICYIYHCKIT